MKILSGLAVAMAFAVGACTTKEAESAASASDTPAAVSAVSDTPRSGASATPSASLVSIKVYKTPTCGCCKAWVEHLEQNGFKAEVVDMPDLSSVKTKYGVAPQLQSCHTAVVGDYTIEGHVPADLIMRLVTEKPEIAGLAVPGMPMGSPGMEGATKESYDVLTFDRAGRTTVYAQR
jgi:hypothetical protein